MSTIQTLGRYKDCKFKACLGYVGRPCLKTEERQRGEKKEGEERKVGYPFIADAGVAQLNSLIVFMRT